MSNSSFLFVSEPQVLNPELCVSRACILLLSLPNLLLGIPDGLCAGLRIPLPAVTLKQQAVGMSHSHFVDMRTWNLVLDNYLLCLHTYWNQSIDIGGKQHVR